MKLTDLDPRWVGAGGAGVSNADGSPVPERTGVGLSFDCPCGCESRCFVHISNPMDGGKSYASPGQPSWDRTGDTFETLTLKPSIQRLTVNDKGCKWHGFVTDGEIITV